MYPLPLKSPSHSPHPSRKMVVMNLFAERKDAEGENGLVDTTRGEWDKLREQH